MAVQVSYPGVYIEEFAPGAPIQGVGTSTAGFIGPTTKGELDEPTKLTSWDQFLMTYGEKPISDSFFLWYAVKGFFENGGQVCYVVRASNGSYGELAVNNRAGAKMMSIRARKPGILAPPIEVQISSSNVVSGAALYQPTAAFTAISGRDITVSSEDEAARFRPGDWLDVGGLREQLVRVSADVLSIAKPLTGTPSGTVVRLADAGAGETTLRIEPAAALPNNALVAGTMLTIDPGTPFSVIVEAARRETSTRPAVPETYRVTLREGLQTPLSMDPANPAAVQSEEFDITVNQGASNPAYTNLAIDSAHPRYFLDYINNNDELVTITLEEPPPIADPPANLPVDMPATGIPPGTAEDLSAMNQSDYIEALDELRDVDDVNIIAIPDAATLSATQASAVQQALIAHCELLADRFAVLDARPGSDPFVDGTVASVETQREGLDSTRGYAAFYYPWLRVFPANSGAPILVPPSGHVCGIIARSDQTRGVHKAPANEIVNGTVGVERRLSDIDQGQLNLAGTNVIRIFNGGRPTLWGARTTATDRNWQYVNIRRLFLYLEESIQEGIRWAVFEPNNLQLWQKLKRTITEFLLRAWRDGALFGEKQEDAFYVRIDKTLNPFSEQQLGRLNIEIGLRPTYPAEFIVVRIGIWPGGSEVSES